MSKKNKDNRVYDWDDEKTQYTWCQSEANIWIFKHIGQYFNKYSLYLNLTIYTLQMLFIIVF